MTVRGFSPLVGNDKGVRVRSPMCLNLGGRGCDLPIYANRFGGCCLILALSLYAYVTLEWRGDRKVGFSSPASRWECRAGDEMDYSGALGLHKAVYHRMVRDFARGEPLCVTLTTWSETDVDSGLATSSALAVAMVEAFNVLLGLGLGQRDIAGLAYEIERLELGEDGGQHDHYAVALGGCNFLEFRQDQVIINPLRLRYGTWQELESGLILFETDPSRDVPAIIARQCELIESGDHASLQALHQLKQEAALAKEALLRSDVRRFGVLLADSWVARQEAVAGVSNARLDRVIGQATRAGASSAQVAGTGGGGFLFFLVEPALHASVMQALAREPNGRVVPCRIADHGVESWYLT